MNDELNVQIKKKSLFNGVSQLFFNLKNIFKSKKYKDELITDYLTEPGSVDKAFDDVKTAANLCDSAIKIAQQRIEFVDEHKELLVNEQNLIKFENFTNDDFLKLKEILNKVDSIKKEKAIIKNQLSGADRHVDYLAYYEDQFPKILNDIMDAEERQRLIKIDISLLEGERENLLYDQKTLEAGLSFIYKFSIFLICFFSFFGVLLVFLNIFYSIDIFMVASIEALLAIGFGTAIFILNRRMKYDLQKNIFFQTKVVALLNKRKLHYVHYTSYLNYEFKKFHVRSAINLKNNWDEYCYYKHLSGRFKTVNNIFFDLEDDLQRFLVKRNIIDSKYVINNISKMVDKNSIKRLKKDNEIEKMHVEEKLNELDETQENIWQQLTSLRDNDKTADRIIDKMITDYFAEAEF